MKYEDIIYTKQFDCLKTVKFPIKIHLSISVCELVNNLRNTTKPRYCNT